MNDHKTRITVAELGNEVIATVQLRAVATKTRLQTAVRHTSALGLRPPLLWRYIVNHNSALSTQLLYLHQIIPISNKNTWVYTTCLRLSPDSGGRQSNWRPSGWQTNALITRLPSHHRSKRSRKYIIFSRTTWVSRSHKGKAILDTMKQKVMSMWDCSGIGRTIYNQSAPCCRQLTTLDQCPRICILRLFTDLKTCYYDFSNKVKIVSKSLVFNPSKWVQWRRQKEEVGWALASVRQPNAEGARVEAP